jgi:hypothetical protein
VQQLPPPIPVYAKGPLGIVQLPRLWSKVLLSAQGRLREGYSACGDGFDRVVLEGLGLDREEVVQYLTSERPSYFAFEAWILAKKGGTIPAEAVQSINDYILNRVLPEERRTPFKERSGLPLDLNETLIAQLNTYDDWMEWHRVFTTAE